MSTQREGPRSVSKKPAPKMYFCEVCNVPCMSPMILQTHYAGMKHKKREKLLKTTCSPVIYNQPQSARRLLQENIRCLKDYMKHPDRDEPLVGVEYLLEVRYQGRRDPCYECHLCHFNTEMMPMIEHLTGQKHRKMYLSKHIPYKGKKNPNEDKARFLKRLAGDVEKEQGLKMYKREGIERPREPSAAEKKKARWRGSSYMHENDPVMRQKALEYMDFFEITSDTEATEVIRIAQSLSESLKTFCEKKVLLSQIKSLPSLMPPVHRNTMLQKPNQPYENFRGDKGDKMEIQGHMSNGVAQFQTMLGGTSHTYQKRDRTSSYTISSSDLATVSALRKSLAPESAGLASGISDWMKEFSRSASVYFQSHPDREKSLCFTSSQSSCTTRYRQGSSSQKHDNRTRNWDSVKDSYSATREYPANCPSQDSPSWYNGNSDRRSVSLPAESSGPGAPQSFRYQRSNLPADGEVRQPPFRSGSSYGACRPQNMELKNLMGLSPAGLSANLISQLRGKDPATLTKMLQELVPHYPDLQKIDIYALAQLLSNINEECLKK